MALNFMRLAGFVSDTVADFDAFLNSELVAGQRARSNDPFNSSLSCLIGIVSMLCSRHARMR
jgi:hypothetical protein